MNVFAFIVNLTLKLTSRDVYIIFLILSPPMNAAQGNKELDHTNQQVPHTEEKIFTDEELHTLVDPILQSDDLNHDGYITSRFSHHPFHYHSNLSLSFVLSFVT